MSTLRAVYQSYLANPDASAFASDGSLNYITTLTTLHKTDVIAKHLAAQQKSLKKKHENVLHAIESDDALCLEVETTLEFLSGGGMYLPGIDDNFLADQLVTFPVVRLSTAQSIAALRSTDCRVDPHRSIRCSPKDPTAPIILGPSFAPEAD